MEPQIKYAKTSDGVNIPWFALGSGSPYVWQASALTSVGEIWRIPELRAIFEEVSSRARLICFDPRGFGLSDRGQMDYSCEAMVRDLEAVADAAALEPFVLHAWSYLGLPALTYAERHPERVTALILLNGIVRGADLSDTWRSLVRLAGEDWEYAKRLLIGANEAGYTLTLSLDRTLKMIDRTASQESFLAFCRAMHDWDASDIVGRVMTPALVTHYGDLALYNPQEASRRLAASLPNGTFASVAPEDGHSLVESASRAIRGFLRGALPRPERPAAPLKLPSGTAIILFADIADSTGLTERLGDTAFREKARDLDAALRAIIRENAGTPIDGKLLGDGVLATFASAAKAIGAALACGRAGDEFGLPLHLGLHAGDVIREENNVYGGAVNIASRISGLSAPGEVLISRTVADLARTSAGVSFEDRSEHALKGVAEPQRVFAVRKDAN